MKPCHASKFGLVSSRRELIPPTNSWCPDRQCGLADTVYFHHKADIMTPTCNWSIRRTPGGPAIDPTGLGSILGQVTQTRYSKSAYLPNNDHHTIHAAYCTLHIGLWHGCFFVLGNILLFIKCLLISFIDTRFWFFTSYNIVHNINTNMVFKTKFSGNYLGP